MPGRGSALTSDQARRVYDRIGRMQDWQRFYEDPATAELIRHGEFERARAVVEMGCGTGRFAAGLLDRHLSPDATYVGTDVSSRMIALARDRLRPWHDRASVTLVSGDDPLPVADGAADRFVSNYVFDLLLPKAMHDALAEAHRVVLAGGLLCVASLTDGEQGLARAVSRVWHRVWERWPALVGGCRPVRVLDALDSMAWEVRHRRTIAAWGITSEAVVAARR
jgi:ubiquinone/menaquinone biosynthesis C-methylase UbiE